MTARTREDNQMLRLVNGAAESEPRVVSRGNTRALPARSLSGGLSTAPADVPSSRSRGPSIARTDPRWVFAVLVASRLEGGRAAVLRPEQRERLLRAGRGLGLRPFDAALAIALVQDAARRGEAPGQTGAGGPGLAERLGTIPEPARRKPGAGADMLSIAASALFLATALVGLAIMWVQTGG